jgi:hypothetical protein
VRRSSLGHSGSSTGGWKSEQQLKADAFYAASIDLATIGSWIAATTFARKDEPDVVFHKGRLLDEQDRLFIAGKLTRLREHLDALGARVTMLTVEDAQKRITGALATWGNVEESIDEIGNNLRRELSLLTLLVLEPKEQAYFEPKELHFGLDVALGFLSTASFEIDEAAKCLALGRSTAAVFHLMRVMEIGIRAVARCLQIPDPTQPPNRNWGNILREIKADLDAHTGRSPTKTWTVPNDKEFFESAYVSLDAVRVAWRNTTMHVEKKYTDDEAKHIFVAVRGFMMGLASRCDENGDPKA